MTTPNTDKDTDDDTDEVGDRYVTDTDYRHMTIRMPTCMPTKTELQGVERS